MVRKTSIERTKGLLDFRCLLKPGSARGVPGEATALRKLGKPSDLITDPSRNYAEANARQERAGDGTKAPSTSRTSIFAILSAILLCTSAICGESRNAFSFRSLSS